MVHTRDPRRLFRELGLVGGAAVSVSLLGTIAASLFGPLFGALMVADIWSGSWAAPASRMDALWGAASLELLLLGLASIVWPQALVLRRAGRLDLLVWSLTLPVYLCLVSVTAWRALAEATLDPQHWNKTEHGLAERPGVSESLMDTDVAPDQAATFQAPRPLALIS